MLHVVGELLEAIALCGVTGPVEQALGDDARQLLAGAATAAPIMPARPRAMSFLFHMAVSNLPLSYPTSARFRAAIRVQRKRSAFPS